MGFIWSSKTAWVPMPRIGAKRIHGLPRMGPCVGSARSGALVHLHITGHWHSSVLYLQFFVHLEQVRLSLFLPYLTNHLTDFSELPQVQ